MARRAAELGLPRTPGPGRLPGEERTAHGIGDGLVRLSVGLETLPDLLDDLGQALERAKP